MYLLKMSSLCLGFQPIEKCDLPQRCDYVRQYFDNGGVLFA